jgi:hypothetical protein
MPRGDARRRTPVVTSGSRGGGRSRERSRREAAPSVKRFRLRADDSEVPPGINLPKAAIAFAAAGSALVGASFGFLVLAFASSGSPDFSFEGVALVWTGAPMLLAVFCGWLLRRYRDAITRAGRDVRASLTALVWLVNFGLSLGFALYLLEDAPTGTHYRGVPVGPELVSAFAAAAFAVAFGCAWAIARSLRVLAAGGVTAALAVALELSEAIDVWLRVKGL